MGEGRQLGVWTELGSAFLLWFGQSFLVLLWASPSPFLGFTVFVCAWPCWTMWMCGHGPWATVAPTKWTGWAELGAGGVGYDREARAGPPGPPSLPCLQVTGWRTTPACGVT